LGGSVYWELGEIVEGGLQKWSISLCGSSVRGNWRGGFFTGDPEGFLKNSGDGHLSTWGPCWRTWKGAHLPGTPPSRS